LEHFVVIWQILWQFGVFSRFGVLYQKNVATLYGAAAKNDHFMIKYMYM
jgi:hypothetical protein